MRNASATGFGIYIAAGSTASQYVQRWANYNNDSLATLDGVGNFGLGVTPSAWALAGASALQIKNAGFIGFSNNAYVTANEFVDSAGASKYIATAAATRYVQSAGTHAWFNAASGTAGNTISFTQAMTLDASGRLQLGTTTSGGDLTVFEDASSLNKVARFVQANSSAGTLGAVEIVSAVTGGSALDVAQWNNVSGSWIQRWYENAGRGANDSISTTATFVAGINTDGNLLVGDTSNPGSARLHVKTASNEIARFSTPNGTLGYISIGRPDATTEGFQFGYSSLTGDCTITAVATTHPIIFKQSTTERARIDSSGNLLVGANTNYAGGKFLLSGTAYITTSTATTATTGWAGVEQNPVGALSISRNGSNVLAFFHTSNASGISGTPVGTVSITTTTTSYNTSSDQRLKENIQNADSASSLIDFLQVRKFDWKADGSHQRYGFVAQELVTVAPEAVHQPTDTEEMMAVDYSKLVPMLVKEIQSLRQRLSAANL